MAGLLAVVLAENLPLGASAFELLSSPRASLLLMRGRKTGPVEDQVPCY